MKKYRVLNVKCEGCASTLKSKLEPLFGEVEVDLDVMPREITIYKDEIDEKLLRERLKKLGYPVVDEELNFIEEVGTKAKSFISCAVGKMSDDEV
jgi:copper chaperone CopZ